MPRTRADAQRNRTAILEAAARLFARGEETHVADVAAEAGVTRTTVYRHFADRDDLLDALVIHVAADEVPTLLAELESLPLPDALDVLAREVVRLARAHRHLVDATAHRFEQAARTAVADEPILSLLRRDPGVLAPDLSAPWLAVCVRSLCLTAVFDERPAGEVAADLARSLRRLLLARP